LITRIGNKVRDGIGGVVLAGALLIAAGARGEPLEEALKNLKLPGPEYKQVSVAADGSSVTFADPKKIKRKGNVASGWELHNLPNGNPYNPAVKSELYHMDYDCVEETFILKKIILYPEQNAQGNPISIYDGNPRDAGPVVPNSLVDWGLKFFCNPPK